MMWLDMTEKNPLAENSSSRLMCLQFWSSKFPYAEPDILIELCDKENDIKICHLVPLVWLYTYNGVLRWFNEVQLNTYYVQTPYTFVNNISISNFPTPCLCFYIIEKFHTASMSLRGFPVNFIYFIALQYQCEDIFRSRYHIEAPSHVFFVFFERLFERWYLIVIWQLPVN